MIGLNRHEYGVEEKGKMGMQMYGLYGLENIYIISEKEKEFLENLEKKPARVLELYKGLIKPKGILNSLCFWLDVKLSTRYSTIKQILRKRKKEAKSIENKL